jgi:hypothetical protein
MSEPITTERDPDVAAPSLAARARLLARFTEAWEAKDLDGLMALMADAPCFRASVGPEPGASFDGAVAVRDGFARFLGLGTPPPAGAVETVTDPPLIAPGFAVTRWTTRIHQPSGPPVVVRACDIFGFEGDRIKSKDTYRKVAGDLPR